MDGKLIILGCGGSAGVPAIGNYWGKCDPNEPKNIRTRPSIALQTESTLVIVDTGPDFKGQMNRENLGCPDAVFITHAHSDHVNGIDDLRVFQKRHKRTFPVYALSETHDTLRQTLNYMFQSSEDGLYSIVCESVEATEGQTIEVGDIAITPFKQIHGSISSMGLRIGNVAYSTDILRLEEPAYEILHGIDTWVVDAASYHGTAYVHANISDVIAMNKRVGAKRVFLTHMSLGMDYATLKSELPAGFEPAYDGLKLDFSL